MQHLQVGLGCKIHRLHICNEYPVYDIKHSDGEAPVMLEFWEMRSIPLLLLLPGLLWPRVIAPDRLLSMGQIELLDNKTQYKQMGKIEL